MNIEQKFKTVIGEQAFQIIVLSHQLEEAQKRIQELETPKEDK